MASLWSLQQPFVLEWYALVQTASTWEHVQYLYAPPELERGHPRHCVIRMKNSTLVHSYGMLVQ